MCAGLADGMANGLAFMAAQVVENDDIARCQRREQRLLDIGLERFAVDRLVEHDWGGDPVVPQGCDEGQRAPAAVRHFGQQPLAARASAVSPRHVRLGPGLVNKDEAARIELMLVAPPAFAFASHVRSILLGCVQAF